MQVRAKRLGYYGDKRQKEGAIFTLVDVKTIRKGKELVIPAEKQFSDRWMEKVIEEKSKPGAASK